METATKERLLDAGMSMLLQRGYNHLGIQDILAATGVPKGSFYHHFASKEDFGLQVIDRYMAGVHAGLAECLGGTTVPPLQRVRGFFEATRDSYRREGYLGCLLGGLGQELSGVNDVFRQRIESCIQQIAAAIERCLVEAVDRGDLPGDTTTKQLANLLCDCWEGAALRSRLLRDPAPLGAMLDFYFGSVSRVPVQMRSAGSVTKPRSNQRPSDRRPSDRRPSHPAAPSLRSAAKTRSRRKRA